MFNLRVLCRDHPQRTIALVTSDHVLIFHYGATESGSAAGPPRCRVEFSDASSADLEAYRPLGAGYGTLGLVTLNDDVFVCVITTASQAANVRPGETVARIESVDFYCLNRIDYEYGLDYETSGHFAADERPGQESREVLTDHPFLALKKLLGDGSFYYSLDFNLTDRLQDRADKSAAFDIDSLDQDMLWNSYMIKPLLNFRQGLPPSEKAKLDASRLLTCVIRGYAGTLKLPATIPILPNVRSTLPSLFTIISRQSSRRAGTRFNSRGIDDDGHVANFVETEVILWVAPGIVFSYVQVRGSIPIFWEQTPGLIPGQQKIEITRSSEATQHAFDQHFEALALEYGAVHVVNLLSEQRSGEADLSAKYRKHIARSSLRQREADGSLEHSLLRLTEYDFQAETRGPTGYEASNQIRPLLSDSLGAFSFFLSEEHQRSEDAPSSSFVILQQEGVFRTNCLDCLDRTNLVQTIISSMSIESFLHQQGGRFGSDMQMRHSTLWADNGDALSKIYAGTGALKSSFTRSGKMSLAGALADARKSATRLYVNNFTDKARQKTIDLLLGRLANQIPVYLYDPVNDMVTEELARHASEFSTTRDIRLWVGSFNVNGRNEGPGTDLTPWLFPEADQSDEDPVIFGVAFQEIVDLSPQQIMSTDPGTRKVWERAVQDCLNRRCKQKGTGRYVLLRSGQLVGAALMIYVKADSLHDVKNVEGAVKKTGLSGIAGNKGGCAIRFELCDTSICLVTAHLAAGFANYDERNKDYETIHGGLRFQKSRSIADHDVVIWLGDFNYRIGLANQIVRDLVAQREYPKLYEHDQLNLQMVAGRAFQYYQEGRITFPPTYKYDIGTETYDTSDKGRIPAWCDRVLWRGNLRQTNYQTAPLLVSDHRPVWATFESRINVIDHARKDHLRRQIYENKQRDALSDAVNLLDLDDEDSAGPVSIAPGLPPASSDRSRWWLDNEITGAPGKATLQPPGEGLVPNPPAEIESVLPRFRA
ncbi:hypothetical protein N7468_005755 [Penicillium chermesinum]|uniref:phosphoinositide 5-phosphatase n=1 Tax=Penicillium chermesinum TaxID=63820 RepID=A0A9W9NZW8_9EURO|nr:uncharacterized protein N7468_005755 [Penicillium chermesinum]KAJ5232799.1 hypothetical protein N7468_005755 [Penicillium chermesinum]